jgi:DNA-binding MarR family transcriptional regulator
MLAASATCPMSPRACWLLYRVADNAPIASGALATRLGIPPADLSGRLTELVAAGYVTANGQIALTALGEQAARRLAKAREEGIDRLMAGWEPERNAELRQLLGRITSRLVATDDSPEREAAGPTAA